jgi:hypothetical protein
VKITVIKKSDNTKVKAMAACPFLIDEPPVAAQK